MSYIQFESSRVKEAERQALREAREKVLIDVSILTALEGPGCEDLGYSPSVF